MTPSGIRAVTAIYRVLLLLCPSRLRRAYGADMTMLFRERCARAAMADGVPGLLGCALRGWGDVISGALADRLRPPTSTRSPSRGVAKMGIILQDLRIAIRTFVRQPFFTAMVLVTLAIGIGATTSIFGLVNSAVLRPLPYPRPDGIVSVVQSDQRFGLVPFAAPYLAEFRDRLQQFETLAAFTSSWSMTLTGAGEPRTVAASYVSDGLLELLGGVIAHGRNITAEEHTSTAARVAVVSRSFWQQQFGPETPFDERIIRLDDTPHHVVGVLSDELRMPIVASLVSSNRTSAEIWLPLSTNELATARNIPIANMVGRLRRGVTLAQAQAEMDVVVVALDRAYPELSAGGTVRVLPLRDVVTRDVRAPLLLLLGAVIGLLLIACANVSNLLLARAAGRTGELAVRVSLGATRARLMAQMVTESFALSTVGAALGLCLAWWCLRAFPALGFERLPPSATPDLDGRAAVFVAGCAMVTTLLIGVIPALQASRWSPHALMRQGGRTIASRGRRLRQALVFGEVSVALVLLIGAGLLARSFWTLTRVDPGLRAEQVLAAGVSLPASRYPTGEARLAFADAALVQLAALPGVERVALVNRLPFRGSNTLVAVEVEGLSAPGAGTPTVDRRVVSTDYFATMAIPVLAGRAFDIGDRADASDRVAVVNATAARNYWPEGQALGRRVRLMLRSGPGPWLRITGIVGDVRHHGLDQPPQPEIYVPYAQAPVEGFVLLLRSGGDPLALAPALRATILRLDPNLALQRVGVASDGIAESIAEPKVRALILNVFAVVALLLAAIGIYGVISYSVSCRTRDIGLRLAFGAQRAAIFQLVLREGMGLVVAGAIVGIAGSLALTRVLEAQLFGVSATDPATFVAVTAILLFVAFLAHVIPARRAMQLDPVEALRRE